jgi:hypothetical protein
MSSWKVRLLMAFTMLAMVIAVSAPGMAQIGDDEEEFDDLDDLITPAQAALLDRDDLEDLLEEEGVDEELADLLDDGGFRTAAFDDDGVECDEFLVEYSLPGWPDDLFAVVDDDDLQEFVDWVEGEGGIVWDITCWEWDF